MTTNLEKIIGYISPGWGLKRELNRQRASILTKRNKYEGASNSKRMQGKPTKSTSANKEIEQSLEALRARSRKMVRDTWIGEAAIRAVQTNTIGKGILPYVVGNDDLNAFLTDFAQYKFLDGDRRHNLCSMQRLIMRSVAEGGEVFVVRNRTKSNTDSPIPFEVFVYEGDFVPMETVEGKDGANSIIQGIEFDALGKRIAYHMYNAHPGEELGSTERVLAEDVIHVYRADRAGQVRGVPWGAPVLVKTSDYDEFEDAQLVRQKISACFSAFITSSDFEAMPGEEDEDKPESLDGSKLQPGLISKLRLGENITFANPVAVTGYAEFSSITLHAIAAGFGITYEALTGDYSKVNYSSAKMAHLKMQANVEIWQDDLMFNLFLSGWAQWFLEAAALVGYDTDGVKVGWDAPVPGMLDEEKEAEAGNKMVRYGFRSPLVQIRKFGNNPEQVITDTAKWYAMLDAHGIKYDTDGRAIGAPGRQVIDNSKQPESEVSDE